MKSVSILRVPILIVILPAVLALPSTAFANHQSSFIWPNGSFLWLSARVNHDGEVGVVSNNCDSTLTTAAFTAIIQTTTQTINAPELPDMPLGYNLVWTGDCSGVVGSNDILLQYEDRNTWRRHGHSDVGGVTFHSPADAAWCATTGTFFPCGDHPVTIHLNLQKITAPGYPLVGLLMHEMGHATGLADHCTSDAVMNNGLSDCNNGRFPGQWFSTDRAGLYDVYHPHEAGAPTVWESVKVLGDSDDLRIVRVTRPVADVSLAGRIFVGFRNDKVASNQWEIAWSDDAGETWHRETHATFLETTHVVATMLSHGSSLSIYAKYQRVENPNYQIWRQTWSGTSWGSPVKVYEAPTSASITSLNLPLAAHRRDHGQYALAWTRFVAGVPQTEFSFVDPSSGGLIGSVESVGAFIVRAFIFDENGNPRVIYRVAGSEGAETGTGGRRTRVGGVWQPEEQFPIDGMSDPDAFFLLDGESTDLWSGSNAASGDHHGLRQPLTGMTLKYRKRLDGVWWEEDINFRMLARPIVGPNTDLYANHGQARQVFRQSSGFPGRAVGTIWVTDDVSPFPSDLWFIKRSVERP